MTCQIGVGFYKTTWWFTWRPNNSDLPTRTCTKDLFQRLLLPSPEASTSSEEVEGKCYWIMLPRLLSSELILGHLLLIDWNTKADSKWCILSRRLYQTLSPDIILGHMPRTSMHHGELGWLIKTTMESQDNMIPSTSVWSLAWAPTDPKENISSVT